MPAQNEFFALANPVSVLTGKSKKDLTRDDLIKVIAKKEIERITFHYTGIDGKIKELKIPVCNWKQAEIVLTEGERVDGSSLFKGLVDASNSDLYVVPLYRTAFLNPFDDKSLDFICRFFDKDGNLASFPPDNILMNASTLLKKKTGLELHALGELEFYLIGKYEHDTYPLGKQRGYHASGPFVKSGSMINEMLKYITQITGSVKYAHNEVGYINKLESDFEELRGKSAEQVEIEFLPDYVEDAADNLVIASWIIRNVAFRHNFIATFFPKLDVGHAGNGLHIHMALMKDGKNLMIGSNGALSDEALKLIGGLCHYAPSMTAFGNMCPASYMRLVPNQEAPTRVCWSERNRSALIRVPLAWTNVNNLAGKLNTHEYKALENQPVRQTVELRSPDGSANCHLLLSGIVMAAEWGLSNSHESLELASNSYVNVDIHKTNISLNLPELATSCTESADRLLQHRTLFERESIFPNVVIDYVSSMLENENDENLNNRLMALPENERLFQSRRLMHREIHKH